MARAPPDKDGKFGTSYRQLISGYLKHGLKWKGSFVCDLHKREVPMARD
jgi:hypothetical protein